MFTTLTFGLRMFKKRIKWYGPSIKSLILSGIFLFIAKRFLRGIEKQAVWGEKKPVKVKKKFRK